MPHPNDNIYLSVQQVADRLGVSTDTVWRWKRNGTFPAAVRLGPKMTRWRLSDIVAFEASLQACFAMKVNLPGLRF